MRLIDADAFAEFLRDAIKQQKYDDLNIDELLTVADVIEAIISELDGTSLVGFKNTPTIEPERKKGKWIRITQGAIPEIYICPFCNRTLKDAGMDSLVQIRYPFCHCGADMREEN